jgi:hypothetical protein
MANKMASYSLKKYIKTRHQLLYNKIKVWKYLGVYHAGGHQ